MRVSGEGIFTMVVVPSAMDTDEQAIKHYAAEETVDISTTSLRASLYVVTNGSTTKH